MGFLLNWFGQLFAPKQRPVQAAVPVGDATVRIQALQRYADTPGTTAKRTEGAISFDEKLISDLLADHAGLLALYGRVQEAADAQRYSDIGKICGVFKLKLQGHVMRENVKLYAYLSNQKKGLSGDTHAMLTTLKSEMDGIGRVAMRFFNEYQATPPNSENIALFKAELEEIGRVLVARIQVEETTIYPLYD